MIVFLQIIKIINMATFDIIMPKLGESVEEATITKWFVELGDTIEEDQPIVELATDKVDSEVPPVEGKVIKLILKKMPWWQ